MPAQANELLAHVEGGWYPDCFHHHVEAICLSDVFFHQSTNVRVAFDVVRMCSPHLLRHLKTIVVLIKIDHFSRSIELSGEASGQANRPLNSLLAANLVLETMV